ncbi:hypothetical protein B0G75_13419 [Paraburkholderia sp. BL18I3N2]|nr:hypothetical protein B0G75_13419 [Paraburkholderia sp. BL18I3N2]PRX89968.1 hypothetical protein B0G73_14519 [Paraburkholderia sp. BL25I1N1]
MTPGHLIPSPLGDIVSRAEDDLLTALFLADQHRFPSTPFAQRQYTAAPLILQAQEQIAELFTGERRVLAVSFQLRGRSFQPRIGKELTALPYGTVVSYGTIAKSHGFGPGNARSRKRYLCKTP